MKTIQLAATAAITLACMQLSAFAQTSGTMKHESESAMPMESKTVYKLGDLIIRQPWARATPKGAPVAGGYVTITNTGKSADRLTGGTFNGAGMVQIHEMSVTGGVMKMRHLEKGLDIKPGATVTLKPGSYHLMFMRLKGGVAPGTPVNGSLTFAKAGKIDVVFRVSSIGSKAPPALQHDHGAMHKH